jgi:endonuclease/exonuclease/phosphatase (EEP) superfamily protein YafD
MEVDNRWQSALSELEATYPFNKRSARQDNFGIAFFSRLPLESIEIVKIEESPVESVLVRCRIEGKPLLIIGTHPTPPIGRTYSTLRNQQLGALARIAATETGEVILLGDLNVTPWSPFFRDLLQNSHLRDSRTGFGVQPSWPTDSLIKRIPIDHCLISQGIDIYRRWIGPDVGSDHFPVVVEFSLNGR